MSRRLVWSYKPRKNVESDMLDAAQRDAWALGGVTNAKQPFRLILLTPFDARYVV